MRVTVGAFALFLHAAALPAFCQPSQLPNRVAPALVAELGCANCHTDLKIQNSLRDRTPDLSSAGLRYNPAYLFDFLQNPVRVRRHLGRARMPNFHLSPKEALALVAFLETQRQIPGQWPELPEEIKRQVAGPAQNVSKEQFQAEITSGLICFTCHTLDGNGGVLGVELGNIGYQLQPAWVKSYLVQPAMFGVPPATMPPQFYQLSQDGRAFQEITARAAGKIGVVSDYLFSLNEEKRRNLEEKLRAAKAAFPNISAALGEKIFTSQNCAACHRHQTIPPRLTDAAPELAREGERVTRTWLESYLKRSGAIRPFGYRPGDGSRMPDFRLSEDEVSQLSAFLTARSGEPRPAGMRRLSAFASRKAATLLADKLSCLGCHRLGERGGRIGPDLSQVKRRLRPAYVQAMIADPRRVNPHTVMPKIPMTAETLELISNFVSQQEGPTQEINYLSLADYPLILFDSDAIAPKVTARGNYLTYCAACHGSEGQGNGFNAQFLPIRPTVHAESAYMATRPDDTLYDAIHSGGYILNKSQMMPVWGQSFAPAEISGLVDYLRTLCRCREPNWSLDNRLAR